MERIVFMTDNVHFFATDTLVTTEFVGVRTILFNMCSADRACSTNEASKMRCETTVPAVRPITEASTAVSHIPPQLLPHFRRRKRGVQGA